jgi:lysophospholipase L1-like esterase
VSDPAAPINENTLRLLSRLQDEGVEVMNLFDIFQSHSKDVLNTSAEQLYLTQDTHWSPAGMKLAASSVANRLLQLGWTEKGASNYNLKPVNFSRLGDVLRMSQIRNIEERYIPEIITATQVINSMDNQPYTDDPTSDILILGDSFLRIYERDEPKSGGFTAHLAHELRKPLGSIINDGGASTLVRQELYRKPDLLAGKKVVIWEFVERDIRFGTEGWQDVPLPDEKQRL